MTYQIASGHDNSAGLVAVTSITPAGSQAFPPLRARASYQPGVLRVRADGAFYETGFASAVWTFDVLLDLQYGYLYTTYAADATNANKVTIRTPNRLGVFTTYNARIVLPPRRDLTYVADPRHPFTDVKIQFNRLEAI